MSLLLPAGRLKSEQEGSEMAGETENLYAREQKVLGEDCRERQRTKFLGKNKTEVTPPTAPSEPKALADPRKHTNTCKQNPFFPSLSWTEDVVNTSFQAWW